MADDLPARISQTLESLLLKQHLVPRVKRDAAREEAIMQFRSHQVNDGRGTTAFYGALSQILEETETFSGYGGKFENYVLTIVCVTPENRYFLFKSRTQGAPYISELPATRAKLLLKERFREYDA